MTDRALPKQAESLLEWRLTIFTPKERRTNIRGGVQDLREWGVPDEALTAVEQYAASMLCEGCQNEANSGPYGPDGVYLCGDCLVAELEQHGFTRAQAKKQAAREGAFGAR